mmetsp:Transcript_883/g.1908  ORF Transcript_883/g.1908 Transcript_883/m.1908 type:complete len:424 (-) Transcript_883:1853-3124(-)
MSPNNCDGVVWVLDNGGGSIKSCMVNRGGEGTPDKPPDILHTPNSMVRAPKSSDVLVGRDVLSLRDVSGLTFRRPVDRGCVTSWDLQQEIWDHVFHQRMPNFQAPLSTRDAFLVVTEPPGNPLHCRAAMDALVFEEFQFQGYVAVIPQKLVAIHEHREIAVVLDVGFSFANAVPLFPPTKVNGELRTPLNCTKRLNLGGKALTNFLKETISFQTWNLMDDYLLVNAIKERLCYTALDFRKELADVKRNPDSIRKMYVLPDGTALPPSDPLGRIRDDELAENHESSEQLLPLCNERLLVPELLFEPGDIGIMQCGVAELLVQAVSAAPKQFHSRLWANVIVVGGSTLFPRFIERLNRELRPLVPAEYDVNIYQSTNPIEAAARGGYNLALSDNFREMVVTKREYDEHGTCIGVRKFLESIGESG